MRERRYQLSAVSDQQESRSREAMSQFQVPGSKFQVAGGKNYFGEFRISATPTIYYLPFTINRFCQTAGRVDGITHLA